MPTFDIKNRIVNKGNAHNIIMSKIKSIYKHDALNVQELGRLCDIPYHRLRRLLFDENGTHWQADEWFRVLVVCGADGAIPQMYKSTKRDLSKYQSSKQFTKKQPKKSGVPAGYRNKVVKDESAMD